MVSSVFFDTLCRLILKGEGALCYMVGPADLDFASSPSLDVIGYYHRLQVSSAPFDVFRQKVGCQVLSNPAPKDAHKFP